MFLPCPVCVRCNLSAWLIFCLLHSLVLTGLRPGCCRAASTAGIQPVEVTLPSAEPSGDPVNDRIWVKLYPAAPDAPQPAAAVVLLHPLGATDAKIMNRFARYLAQRGITGALMTLPYHMQRRPPGERGGGRFTDPDVKRMIQAARQSVSDVSTVVTWLSRQPSVDPHRIGVIGVSLGAIVAHLAMGKDERISAGAAILGGGNLADIRRRSLVYRIQKHYSPAPLGPGAAAELRQVDPLQYADRNQPRRVLMIEAARDLLMPPRDARALWEALGRPPIRWVDTNHFGLVLAPQSAIRTALAYLLSVWDGTPDDPAELPAVHALTLKVGLVSGLDKGSTPALQWQAHSFWTRRDHMSGLHADLGWSGRGPFLGLAGTLNQFMDLGIAHRFNGGGVRPYVSLHVVF